MKRMAFFVSALIGKGTMTLDPVLLAIVIFFLRVLNYAIGTVRLVAIARGRRILAASLAFLEALIFAVVIANVVSDLDNIVNLLSYCLGAAAGSYVGMVLETRLITGYAKISVISVVQGHEIALKLREMNFGVTESIGMGHEGQVSMLTIVVNRKDAPAVLQTARTLDPKAFISMEEAQRVEHGYIPAPHRNR
jgi:uncharacterized protein YebE (UPF0316 family)